MFRNRSARLVGDHLNGYHVSYFTAGGQFMSIEDLKKDIDLCLTEAHFNEFQKSVDMRFADMERRFDRIEGSLKWCIGLFAPVIAGILAIIVKQFLE